MQSSTILSVSVALAVALAWASSVSADGADSKWGHFLAKNGKNYADRDEYARRYHAWKSTCQAADEHNRKNLGFTVSCMHHFADWTDAERQSHLLGYNPRLRQNRGKKQTTTTTTTTTTMKMTTTAGAVPAAATTAASGSSQSNAVVDWRTKGYVTPVKDQGQCGCCWSFAATGALEGQLFRKSGVLTSLSEQNLIDCDTIDQGCNGGLPENAFQYLKTTAGIESESAYPYTGSSGTCAYSSSLAQTKPTSYVTVADFDDAALMTALQTVGPLATGICASSSQFQNYASGIYTASPCSETSADHAVLIVGYNNTGPTPYWIVKNSWSATWGVGGYVNIAMGQQLVVDSVYPVL